MFKRPTETSAIAEKIPARIARGVAQLNTSFPGWSTSIIPMKPITRLSHNFPSIFCLHKRDEERRGVNQQDRIDKWNVVEGDKHEILGKHPGYTADYMES